MSIRAAFCFWTTLTALHPTIFFFSVWNMAAGGHEALLVIQVFALGFASLPFIQRKLILSVDGKLLKGSFTSASPSQVGHINTSIMIVLHILSLTGLCVWTVNDPLTRLLATAISCAGFAILYALQWGRAWELENLDRVATSKSSSQTSKGGF